MSSKTPSTLDLFVEKFNRNHAAVLVRGKFAIMTEYINPETGREDFHLSTKSSLQDFYRNQPLQIKDDQGNIKSVNPIDVWIKHPMRRTYNGIVFDPSGSADGRYCNLWRGFACKPHPGACENFKGHIYDVICGRDDVVYIYVMDWIADMFQHPGGDRPGTALVLRGGQGTGKGFFVSQLGSIVGRHFMQLTNQSHLTGKFNAHLKGLLLVFIDEGFWAGDKRDAGVVKALITEEWATIEQKGFDAIPVKNHIRAIFASNNRRVVPAEAGERRFAVMDVADHRRRDDKYFKAIAYEMDNGGREAFLHEMLNRDIRSNLREIPRTLALFDQVTDNLDSVGRFWLEVLDAGEIPQDGYNPDWPSTIEKRALYIAYRAHCDQSRDRYPLSSESVFGRELRKYCKQIKDHRPTISGKRKQCVLLPSLENARQEFQGVIEAPIPWSDAG